MELRAYARAKAGVETAQSEEAMARVGKWGRQVVEAVLLELSK